MCGCQLYSLIFCELIHKYPDISYGFKLSFNNIGYSDRIYTLNLRRGIMGDWIYPDSNYVHAHKLQVVLLRPRILPQNFHTHC